MDFNKIKKCVLVFTLFVYSGLCAQESVIKTWIIADAKIGCKLADYTTSCYKYKLHKDSNWINFSYDIEGFAYEQGNEYVIEVNEEKLKYPEANGPLYKWSFVRLVSKTNTLITDKRILLNNKWNIINLNQFAKIQLIRKAKANISFDIENNKINGFNGCNTFAGNTNIENGYVQFGNLMSTKMACDSFKADIENRINESLKGKASFYVRNNMLFMTCENNLTLEMRPEKKLDSILAVIQKENARIKENTLLNLGNNNYTLTLINKDNEEPVVEVLVAKAMSPIEKKTLLAILEPPLPHSQLKRILLTKKETGVAVTHIAVLEYKNGSKREIIVVLN